MTVHKLKSYKRLDASNKSNVNYAIDKLKNRYKHYADQKASVPDIFRDRIIVHEVIDNKYLVFKTCAKDVQVRLLYQICDKGNINVLDFYIKNNTNANKSNHGQEIRYLVHFKESIDNIKKKGDAYA